MSDVALATQPIQISFSLDQCLRLFSDQKKRIITVALVTERIDRYNTIIDPDGCITDFRNVIVDFRHSRVSTGARLTNKRIENVTLDTGETVRALVGDIEVYSDSELRLRDPITGSTRSDGNAYQAIENGRILAVSVDFQPIQDSVWKNEATGVIEYKRWSLKCLSLLDVPAGQEDSIILNIRSLNNFTMNTKFTKGQEILIRATVESINEDGTIKITTPETVTEGQVVTTPEVRAVDEKETVAESGKETPIDENDEEKAMPKIHSRMSACEKRMEAIEKGMEEMRGMMPSKDTTRSLNIDLEALKDELRAELITAQSENLRAVQVATPTAQVTAPVGQDEVLTPSSADSDASANAKTEYSMEQYKQDLYRQSPFSI